MGRGNPNPKHKLTSLNSEQMAEQPVGVRLPLKLDAYVRSLPNRTDWLREAIAEKYQRDLEKSAPPATPSPE